MSRCFPFPPPGYERSEHAIADKGALIESIKREEKEMKKQRKREKKEKKRLEKERKELEKKEKSLLNGEIEEREKSKEKKEKSKEAEKERHSHKEKGSHGDKKLLSYHKKGENEVEQLERSSLTEEHGQQASLPKLCDSSDSTQNSGKRKRHISSLDESHNQKGSTMLRIRLPPLLKPKDPEEHINREQACSSRGTEISVGKMVSNDPGCSIIHSISGRTEVTGRDSCKAATVNGFSHSLMRPVSGRTEVPARDSSKAATVSGPSLSSVRSRPIPGRTEVPSRDSSNATTISGPSHSLKRSISERTEVPARDGSKAATVNGSSHNSIRSLSISGRTEDPSRDITRPATTIKGPSNSLIRSVSISGRTEVPSRDNSKAATVNVPSHSSVRSVSISGRTEVRSCDSTKPATESGTFNSLVQPCAISGRIEDPDQNSSKAAAAAGDAKLKVSKRKSRSDCLREVIENWVPPSIQLQPTESEDLEWLFSNREAKRCKVSDVAPCHEVSNSWPRARYLPEAEIYALPYTVPF